MGGGSTMVHARREVVFTRNASEAINLVAYSWGLANLKAGDEVCVRFGAAVLAGRQRDGDGPARRTAQGAVQQSSWALLARRAQGEGAPPSRGAGCDVAGLTYYA